MRRLEIFLAAVLAGSLASCATPYQETGYRGGFEAHWLAPDILAVNVSGNGYTSDARVREYALLQAAERAIEAGYGYFLILDNENEGKVHEYYTPPRASTTTYGSFIGDSYYGSSSTTVTGGLSQVYKPGRTLIVQVFREPPAGYAPGQYYVAPQIRLELGEKYLSD